jgi:hypothetical protein
MELDIQTTEDIQRSSNNHRWSRINYWIDHFPNRVELCNIYSLSLNFYMKITHDYKLNMNN